MAKRWLKQTGWWMTIAATALFAVGIVLRLTLRDRIFPLSTIFYGTPWLVIIPTGFIAATLWFVRKKRVPAIICLIATSACCVFWHVTSYRSHQPIDAPASLRVLLWNVDRVPCNDPLIRTTIDAVDADIIGIVETGAGIRKRTKLYDDTYPNYQRSDLVKQLLCMTSGEMVSYETSELGDYGKYKRSTVRVDGHELTILVVDLQANPIWPRRRSLEMLTEIVADLSDQPLIVMGDFNTPADSVWFDGIRQHMSHAFETAGNGYSETWPLPMPILDLDHIWTNAHVEILRCDHLDGQFLGHQPVVAEIRLKPMDLDEPAAER